MNVIEKLILVSVVLLAFTLMVNAVAVSTALASIDGNYSTVWAYNASDTSDPWKRYRPGSGSNDLTAMNPGFGYWVRVNVTAETLVI